MDPALSELLICPRCGPAFGLVLLPHVVEDRRVVTGVLGCANCRERYAVEGGVADLRVPGESESHGGEDAGGAGVPEVSVWASPGEEAVRLGAFLGLEDTRGLVLLAGPAAEFAGGVAGLSGDISVIAVGAGTPAGGVTGLRASTVLPMRTGAMAGVALTGAYAPLIAEAVRILTPGARLLVEPVAGPLSEPELEVIAQDGVGVVAKRR